MNLFTNVMTGIFYWFTKYANRKFSSVADPATGEKLTEKNRKFEFKKVLELPWVFWMIMAFSLFETSTAIVFQQNATELAEQRFNTDSITAGWYTSVLQYAGMVSNNSYTGYNPETNQALTFRFFRRSLSRRVH